MDDRWINCNESYDERIELMARFIEPNSSVLDLGCGQMALKKKLPNKCTYYPCDLVTRSEDTIVCDLNGSLDEITDQYDYIFCSGILEYLPELGYLISKLSEHTNKFIISYAGEEGLFDPTVRYMHGWKNSFSTREILDMFSKYNFEMIRMDKWGYQSIIYLEKK